MFPSHVGGLLMNDIRDRLKGVLRVQTDWTDEQINRATFEMVRVDPLIDLWVARVQVIKVEKILMFDLNAQKKSGNP